MASPPSTLPTMAPMGVFEREDSDDVEGKNVEEGSTVDELVGGPEELLIVPWAGSDVLVEVSELPDEELDVVVDDEVVEIERIDDVVVEVVVVEVTPPPPFP